MLEFEQDEFEPLARIKVIGVGGGGSNAVKHMIEANLTGVEFYVVNTDLQALRTCVNATQIQIGLTTTGALGAGADPEKGRKAAEEDKDKLKNVVEDADMVFVTAGMGGGTGTGAAPIIANLSKDAGALTIGVVTRPFNFEGRQRAIQAEEGLEDMRESADSVIVIPNQRLLEVTERSVPIRMAFRTVDDILLHAVQSISDLITIPGEINLDFADVRAIMQDAGSALMGIGKASGDNRAEAAARKAISSPLLEETNISGAMGIIVNITGPEDMMMHELEEAMEVIREASDTDQLIFGLAYNETLQDELQVTVIATGFDAHRNMRREASQDDVMSLDDFLGQGSPRATDRSGTSRRQPSNLRGPINPRNRVDSVQRGRADSAARNRGNPAPEPRPGTQRQRREFVEPSFDENVEDVLDIPTFLRVRSSKDRNR